MNKKRRLKNKFKINKFKKSIFYLTTSFLLLILCTFIFSLINRIFFNDGINSNIPNLEALITKSKYEKKTGHTIQIEIWNGCGVPKLANIYTDFLRSEGIDVLDSKNADNFNYINTKIIHHRGEHERAIELANIMGINKKEIITDLNENLFYDITLILGDDYNNLASYHSALMQKKPY